ncbi:MAG TPA: helix-turn-helix domain-containing protein [Thermoanaerobaculia bacterium]|nr:helix-turn-helix domain-containing protein [Thermoanaerobaculia bacterium]
MRTRPAAAVREASSPMRPDDVRAIRYKLKQSQSEFAAMIGISLGTLQSWEEGRHHPDGPARALLRVAARNPKVVAKALSGRG